MSALSKREEEILAFWQKEKIFEKSLQKPAPKGEYIFYDGPPFANGLPHYGHLLAGTIKDAIPRYRTMAGYRVARRWGWDCHGLPVENLVEKELGFKNKRDIERYGVEKFNEAARASVVKDVSDWKRIIPRLGRWADMEADYKTMDSSYTESVWWAFKTLYDKGLVYEGFKAMHLCPRCGTTLSNFEVAQGYKDIDDLAVTVKLPLVDEPHTSLLIWTTTPWTLPGNAAAAVNADAPYVKIRAGPPAGGEFFIVAKERLAALFDDAEVVAEMRGSALVGKRYLPPFDYFATGLHKHKTHAWKVYATPYVTMEDGTGIVHLAPAYGAEDLELAQKEKIPLIQHVTDEGKFTATVRDFAGLPVKPKGNPRETDEKVAALLEHKGLLFKQEKIKHSYPHCWRCETPLLNWAATSWFVKVSSLKATLLKGNAGIGWTPAHVGEARFQNGLLSAPDWAISRSRYWGAPLPVWRNHKTKEVKIVGSVAELLGMVRTSGNRYFVMRHGQAQSNGNNVFDTKGDPTNNLTEQGRHEAKASAAALTGTVDLICYSPLLRTKETAAIVQQALNVPDAAFIEDERLWEMRVGVYDGRPIQEWIDSFASPAEQFDTRPEGGESLHDIRRRVGEFLFDIEKRYKNKNILIVTHECPARLLNSVANHLSPKDTGYKDLLHPFLQHAEVKEVAFTPYPHNADYELDLHRPYIDTVAMGEWARVPDVFDCWFESGSMPFASNHYPFDKERFNPKGFFGFGAKGYPADFIAEGLDQTRGWFYSLMVLCTALFGKSPYKNVIVNGLVLASDGQKMSKRLGNYPDPMEVVGRYGADALRYYLLSSPVVRAEDLRFQEKGIDDVAKKIIMRLDNVRSFYELYAPSQPAQKKVLGSPVSAKTQEAGRPDYFSEQVATTHVLDRWIAARLAELIGEVTQGYEHYALDAATRPLAGFIDDLSTWYVRRSRERFKAGGEDKQQALATLRHVLITLAQVMAPVMPFMADDLYRRLGAGESVHLSNWPQALPADRNMLLKMEAVRRFASQALQAREKAAIKIRQPLANLSVPHTAFLPEEKEYLSILADEVHVKKITLADTTDIILDTTLTPELKEEGALREWVRTIQEWRKEQGLKVEDRPGLLIHTHDVEFVRRHRGELIKTTGLLSLETKEGDKKLERL